MSQGCAVLAQVTWSANLGPPCLTLRSHSLVGHWIEFACTCSGSRLRASRASFTSERRTVTPRGSHPRTQRGLRQPDSITTITDDFSRPPWAIYTEESPHQLDDAEAKELLGILNRRRTRCCQIRL